MKLEKKKILSAFAVLCFGIAVSLVNVSAERVSVPGNTAGSIQITADLSVDDVKTVGESGKVEIDFEALKEQNQDIYAWVTVPGTGIDYPVLQKSDSNDPYDDYYLNHTVDLAEGFPGAIYSQAVNHKDFMDPITVLYGHNLKKGGMFSDLHNFEDRDFFEENRQVIIYLPDRTITYEIFAAVNFSDVLITYEYDFADFSEVRRYLDDIAGCEGNFREGAEASEDNKILTMSTCYSDQDERRLLIEAALVESVPTK